ncbi:MAG: hypothetical protein CM1200mP20_15420 [Pseudomonadota bacterium]|nr:MAG: hypothetical protein CM1200mP20_15420 [Pseudomonadota bacterium]
MSDLQKLGLNGVLLFRPESMYYLTGYESFGYCFFQCMVLGVDGRLCTAHPLAGPAPRAPGYFCFDDVRIWVDGVGDHRRNSSRNPSMTWAGRTQRWG